MQDEDGLFHFVARADDMIISAGYNIAGPEVEAALLTHADVAECAVVGAPDEERGADRRRLCRAQGRRCRASVDMRQAPAGPREGDDRAVQISARRHFIDALPKTQTGKIQRFRLRQQSQP